MSVTSISAARPKKSMTQTEVKLLQVLAQRLPHESMGLETMTQLLRLIASWMGSPSPLGFEAFARAWLQQDNSKNEAATEALRDIFGLNSGPGAA